MIWVLALLCLGVVLRLGFFGPGGIGFGGLLGGGGGGSQFDPIKQQKKLYAMILAQQQQQQALAKLQGKKAVATTAQGYDKAIAAAGAGGSAAKQSILNNQEQALGKLSGSLAQSGLTNTTVNANKQSGIYSQGSQNLAQVDQALAQVLAGLQGQKANAVAGAQGNLASLYMGAGQQQGQLGSQLLGNFSNFQAGPTPLESLLGAAGQIAPFALMASDRRLKRDIERVGVVDGVNVYEFGYVDRPGRFRGVMADEVPWAAVRGADGFLRVDYARVPVRFERV